MSDSVRARSRSSFGPSVEPLEERSVPTTAVLSGGVLQIRGTNAADRILVKRLGDMIKVSGVPRSFRIDQVRQIVINAGGGNDLVRLDPGQPIVLPTRIQTGAGNGVFRHVGLEAALTKGFTPEAVQGVTIDASALNSDLHASAAYRAQLIRVQAQRAVAMANG